MKEVTLTRIQLYDLVWSSPFTTLEKKFFITADGLRRICKRMNIPVPMHGHWNKIQFNKSVDITELPDDYSGAEDVLLHLREEGDPEKGNFSPLTIIEKKIKDEGCKNLIVPGKLTNPHKLTLEAMSSLTAKDRHHFKARMLNTHSHQISIRVTEKYIGRALRFMDTFIKVMEKRGHRIITNYKFTYLVMDEEEIRISFREKAIKTAEENKQGWPYGGYLASGILTFNAYVSFKEVQWKDGILPLEEQMGKIVAFLPTSYASQN